MPSGRVKVFDETRKFGFLLTDSGDDVFVSQDVAGGPLHPGDLVEFEVEEADNGRRQATSITVTKAAPAGMPVGRTLSEPPMWDELEERERQRRAARRRRR